MNLRNLIIGFIILIVGFVSVWFLINQPEADLQGKCCQECREAFNQSPVGVGASGAQCGAFTTAKPLSKECLEFFETNPMTVAACE